MREFTLQRLAVLFFSIALLSILSIYNIKHINQFIEKQQFCFVQDSRGIDITRLNINQASEQTAIGTSAIRALIKHFDMEPVEQEVSYCVPKLLHFLWLGKHIPEKYQLNIQSFVKNNPDYKVHLWTEIITEDLLNKLPGVIIEDVNSERADYSLKDLYDAEPNLAGKADILRYEVIYRNGGVYYDTDSVSLLSFEDLLIRSFVSQINEGYDDIQCSLFGFPKGSRFLEYTLRALRQNIIRQDPSTWIPWKSCQPFFTAAFLKYNDSGINMIHQKHLLLGRGTPNSSMITYQTGDHTWE